MKKIIYISAVLLILATSCNFEEPYASYVNVPVFIDESFVPLTGIAGLTLPITAHAYAPNGCYYNLEIMLDTVDAFHFELYALADYQSHGSCPDILVTRDTLIGFKPAVAGKYIIRVWGTPVQSVYDTITVSEYLP